MYRLLQLLGLLPAAFAAPHFSSLARRQASQLISDKWLVKTKSGSDFSNVLAEVADVLGLSEFKPEKEFHIGDLNGFTLAGSKQLADSILALDSIEGLQQDQRVEVDAIVSQENAPYGLGRISSRTPGSSTYRFDDSAGSDTFVYVIDTGINAEHIDFGGRVSFGFSAIANEPNTDLNGHGTHCAGTAAGTQYGVAKNASIVDVKVIDQTGGGPLSNIVVGLDWILNDITSKSRFGKSVVSMSLGAVTIFGGTNLLEEAAAALVNAGVFVSVAAGNFNIPVELMAPANVPVVCSVGATDAKDARAGFSNYGAGIDIHAPGVDIQSAWIGGIDATNTISGTSMAAPHVAGLGAYLLALEGDRSGSELCNRIIDLSTKDVITDVSGSPNRLAFNGVA
ncbi:Cuticle-degrading protease [Cercospora beticola]|uniref:Cuticle-degrading protease n=1 Tax=Cercospora beticola TaxID=122368 RepID=A0A2G5HQA7_CERBT|nr:Cuticle-degrading protease [Cercospora beticola]PIA94710.1 Cuticle-degrading protease [Cercospora beticola]WPB05175.1 hypothetical protein RHO25_009825 [Cercospora beticola]CAK1364962.1 unnamed protein product [Cercospora beticola]